METLIPVVIFTLAIWGLWSIIISIWYFSTGYRESKKKEKHRGEFKAFMAFYTELEQSKKVKRNKDNKIIRFEDYKKGDE